MSDATAGEPTAKHGATEQGANHQQSSANSANARNARAEELVDKLGERLGYFATLVSQRVEWAVARAREEAEDIWAEAQEVRRNKRP